MAHWLPVAAFLRAAFLRKAQIGAQLVVMAWLRQHLRTNGCVALFALALQLALSFGHVHLDGLTGPSAAQAGILASQAGSHSGAPADSGHHPGLHDYCAICATISLAGSLLLPQMAQPVLPDANTREWRFDHPTALASYELYFPFRARAPPVLS